MISDGPEVLVPYVSHPEGAAGVFKELYNSRRWGIYYLWNQGVPDEEHLAPCARTAKALEAWPKCDSP